MEWTTVLTIILTGIGTILTVVGANIALISWLRADMKSFESKIEGWKGEIQKDSRDFHGRLCKIEQKNYSFNKIRKYKK